MLVLSRKKNESIVINNDITIVVVDIRGDKVRLGIKAPSQVPEGLVADEFPLSSFMAKYLVTGVAGFIAARTAELLLEQGHEVVGIFMPVHVLTARMNAFKSNLGIEFQQDNHIR